MMSLKPVNQFMITIVTKNPSPLQQPSTSLRGKQIRMSSLYTIHRQFSITPNDNFQDPGDGEAGGN